jgi:hypothetical protein
VEEQVIRKRRFAVPNPGPTLLLGAFLCLGHIWHTITTLRGAPPAGAFGLLYYTGMALGIANWIRADRRRLGITSTFDDGFFIFFAWRWRYLITSLPAGACEADSQSWVLSAYTCSPTR